MTIGLDLEVNISQSDLRPTGFDFSAMPLVSFGMIAPMFQSAYKSFQGILDVCNIIVANVVVL